MADPTLIIVAPNGARKTQQDHPALPITPEQMADDVEACVSAGAAMVHLHARDHKGHHSLAIEDNANMLSAVQQRMGHEVIIQLTTEAVGRYQPDEQIALIRELQPEAASFALRELIPDETWEEEAATFFHWLHQQRILAQYILYSADDVQRYRQLIKKQVLPGTGHHLLFVLGRYHVNLESKPMDLMPFLAQLPEGFDIPWAVCAFGQQEHRCLVAASALGGDARVGFENNLTRFNGEQARSNAQQVSDLHQSILSMGGTAQSADSARARLFQSFSNHHEA